MSAVTIGPLMLPPERLSAAVAAAVFLLTAEVMARRIEPRFGPWSWWSVVAFVLGARAGHVAYYFDTFGEEPWRALAIWQGGFFWPTGILAVAIAAAAYLHGLRSFTWSLIPMAVSGLVAIVSLQLLAVTTALPLPDGVYSTLDDRSLRMDSLKGSPVVINLWASWCPPCRREMPMMADLAKHNDAAIFAFVNQGEDASDISSFLSRNNITIDAVLLDPHSRFALHYRVPGLPATLFIGPDGVLRSITLGEISKENLIAGIMSLTDLLTNDIRLQSP